MEGQSFLIGLQDGLQGREFRIAAGCRDSASELFGAFFATNSPTHLVWILDGSALEGKPHKVVVPLLNLAVWHNGTGSVGAKRGDASMGPAYS